MIYSTTYVHAARGRRPSRRRVLGPALRRRPRCSVALIVFLALDYRFLAEHSLFLYGALVGCCSTCSSAASAPADRQRWISLGGFNLQPSEFGRMALALILAMYFGENRRGARNYSDLIVAGLFFLVPFILIAKQPDLGTAVTLVPVCLRHRLPRRPARAAHRRGRDRRGARWRRSRGSSCSRTTRSGRIITFLDPEQDARGAGYQQIQARDHRRIRRIQGQRIHEGHPGQYKFLPVADNDFIFSVLAEEQGFIGVLVALGPLLFVILGSLEAARLAKDRIGAYLVGGIISGFAFQVIYNVTMSAGLAPVKGLTLPLMSYGGSSMIAIARSFRPRPQREDAAIYELSGE